MRSSTTCLAVLCLLLLCSGARAFGILPSDSIIHQDITEGAILNATVLVCRHLAQSSGASFTSPPQPFTAEAVASSCSSPESSKSFIKAIRSVVLRNVRVDLRHALNASFHFDDESFQGGRSIITAGLTAVKASAKQGNFDAAREILGELLHPLQDFYSHSNWVELGNQQPNSNLIRSDTSIGTIAEVTRATCQSCVGDDCRNNILSDILQEGILTSGYFGIVPIVSSKPAGKCSHGGAPDQTSGIQPTGGINKDSHTSSHGHLHEDAARVAISASMQLLADVQEATGDLDFLRMLGVSRGSSRALCIVIDTTSSMREELQAVKAVTSSLVNDNMGTADEPSVYILVPFRDPGFGPLIRTTDPEVFLTQINALTAEGGDDSPEMSLSALQLALTGAPFGSDIFLFTDAPAKDGNLKSPVTAIIERTQTVVNFMLTGTSEPNRGRQRDREQQPGQMSTSDVQLYRELAYSSGGQAIEVSKSQLSEATSIITESSASSLVTLLRAVRTPGRADNFSFSVDVSVRNLTIYITGRALTFTLTGPSGESQSSGETTGSLGTARTVGNLQTLQLKTEVGVWQLSMVSVETYTLKVVGQSELDFLFDFVELSQGLFNGFDVLESRPRAGSNGTLSVSVTGGGGATVTEVLLVETSGSGEASGSIEALGGGDYLARFDRIPSQEFGVRVKGRLASGSTVDFQRQSPTTLRSSNLTITADSENILTPGTPFVVPFAVTTFDMGGNFTVRATNNRGFASASPASLILASGGSANDTVALSAPLDTQTGSDVTLTIEAEAPDATDSNYVVLRFSIVNPGAPNPAAVSTGTRPGQSHLLCMTVVMLVYVPWR